MLVTQILTCCLLVDAKAPRSIFDPIALALRDDFHCRQNGLDKLDEEFFTFVSNTHFDVLPPRRREGARSIFNPIAIALRDDFHCRQNGLDKADVEFFTLVSDTHFDVLPPRQREGAPLHLRPDCACPESRFSFQAKWIR